MLDLVGAGRRVLLHLGHFAVLPPGAHGGGIDGFQGHLGRGGTGKVLQHREVQRERLRVLTAGQVVLDTRIGILGPNTQAVATGLEYHRQRGFAGSERLPQHGTELLGCWCAARFPREEHGMALSAKRLCQARGLCRFPAALGAFERQERAGCAVVCSCQERSCRWFNGCAIVMPCSLNSKNGRAREDVLVLL